MTETLSATIWAVWLLGWVGGTFVLLEGGSVLWAHVTGQQNIFDWTLSDTVRRWSSRYKWLAVVVIGGAAALMWHLFGQPN